MALHKEYQEILDAMTWAYPINGPVYAHHHFEVAIEKCQALADRPRVPLTNDEIDAINAKFFKMRDWKDEEMACAKEIMLAYDAKQLQPVEVPFDYAQWSQGDWQAYLGDDPQDAICTKYLHSYTMRKVDFDGEYQGCPSNWVRDHATCKADIAAVFDNSIADLGKRIIALKG